MEAATALELDDDVFFKDLSRQISLLIMDDDDGTDDVSLVRCPSVNFQAFNQTILPTAQPSFLHYNQQMNKRDQSKGTGVFIPRSMNPGRKNTKPGRFTASGNKFQSSRGLPHVSYSNNQHQQIRIDQSSNTRRF